MAPPLSPNILETDVDALSPIDDTLMGAIRSNLLNLDSQITGGGSAFAPVVQFKLNGPLDQLPGGKAKRVDVAYISNAQTLSNCQLYLDQPGTSGTLEVDLRKLTTPKIPITAITPQYSAAVQSVFRAGTAMATQSITRTTEQIATQSIEQWKPTLNVLSIIGLGSNLWQYNLSAAPDSDWMVGDTVTFSSCTDAANNGSFLIVRVNDYGSQSVVVTNAAGVAQASAAGTCVLRAYAYNFVDPVSPEFVAGEVVISLNHTEAGNNGALQGFGLLIYGVNLGGNNLIFKNPYGEEQNDPAGTIDVLRFSYNFAIPASINDFVVGDQIFASGHTSLGTLPANISLRINNGNLRITAINAGGNNIQVYNSYGAPQGGIAGTVESLQWVIALPTDPSSQVQPGDDVYLSGMSSTGNVGQFTVRQVKRAALNNVTVYNPNGVVQNVVGGTLEHTRKLVKFASDQADLFSTSSWIEIQGVPSSFYSTVASSALGHHVLEINRGGGANYNVVIKVDGAAPAQNSPAGWVALESRSIFSTTPKIAIGSARTRQDTDALIQTTAAVFSDGTLAAGTRLAFYVLSVPTGGAYSIGLQVR
jgi:hypothetical protein